MFGRAIELASTPQLIGDWRNILAPHYRHGNYISIRFRVFDMDGDPVTPWRWGSFPMDTDNAGFDVAIMEIENEWLATKSNSRRIAIRGMTATCTAA
jgi:hypothetical protein